MAGQKSPEASWKEFGSPSLDFCGAIFFVGLFAGRFAGLSPASFSPTKRHAKGTDLSWPLPLRLDETQKFLEKGEFLDRF